MQKVQKEKITIEFNSEGMAYIYAEVYCADDTNPTINQTVTQYLGANDSGVPEVITSVQSALGALKTANGID